MTLMKNPERKKGEKVYPYIDDDKIVFKNTKNIVRNLEYYKRLYDGGNIQKKLSINYTSS